MQNILKMKFLPPAYNNKDLESKQSNKWRWACLSECDTNGEKWGFWLKKTDIAKQNRKRAHDDSQSSSKMGPWKKIRVM